MSKRITALMVALVICLTTMTFVATAGDTEGIIHAIPQGAETVEIGSVTYKVIRTGAELTAINEVVDNYILACDIDYAGATIGNVAKFGAGTVFEGNGCSLLNFTLSSSKDTACFGFVNGELITVRNLTIGSSSRHIPVISTGEGKSVGAVLGYTNSISLLENVTVYADVSSPKSTVGGIYGNAKGTHTMKNCSFYGSVTGLNAAAFFGQNQSTATLENCYNYGTVNGGGDTGGVIGKNSNPATVKNCINFGDINSTKNAAGLGGSVSSTINVTGFLNTGDITGADIVGGIFGYGGGSGSPIADSFVTGKITNTGKNIGGIIGVVKNDNYQINNTVFAGDIECNSADKLMGVIAGYYIDNAGTETEAVHVLKAGSAGNKYIAAAGTTNTFGYSTATEITVDAALTALNTEYADIPFISDGSIPVLAAPVLRGVQETVPTAEAKQSVRFIATIETVNYDTAGFKIKVSYTDKAAAPHTATKTVNCTSVYGKILGTDNGTMVTKTAQELSGKAILALSVDNVPTDMGIITFVVTPFTSIGATVYEGEPVTVVYNNGVFVG